MLTLVTCEVAFQVQHIPEHQTETNVSIWKYHAERNMLLKGLNGNNRIHRTLLGIDVVPCWFV